MILASASPRRKKLLGNAGYELVIEPADVDERRLEGESPCQLVLRLAELKADACLKMRGTLESGQTLLAADTIVWMGTEALGKPCDDDDARRMLKGLSGKTHHVSTGVCLMRGTSCGVDRYSFVETTDVTFKDLTDAEIDAYVATGEPLDKAGAYGIQGGAGAFVAQIKGDYDNVVGLPVTRVQKVLSRPDFA